MGALQPAKDKWDGLERGQKIKILAVVLVFLVALAITVYFATRIEYAVVERDLTVPETGLIMEMLRENNIRARSIERDTAVEVESAMLSEARILIASRGLASGRELDYVDALNLSGMGATETVTRENLLRSTRTDIERAITTIDGVLAANVQIQVPPSNLFFVQNQDRATASAVLQTSRQLSPVEGRGIARFISSSIIGLDIENVEVLDTNLTVLFSGSAMDGDGSALNDMHDFRARDRARMVNQVRELFNAGYTSITVAPNLQYSNETSTTNNVVFDSPFDGGETGIPVTERTDRASATGAGVDFEPGVGANNAQIPTYPWGWGGEMSATSDRQERDFAVNRHETTTVIGNNEFIPNQSSVSVTLIAGRTREQHVEELLAEGSFTQRDWEIMKRENADPVRIVDEERLDVYRELIRSATGIDDVTVHAWTTTEFIDTVPSDPNWIPIMLYIVSILLLLALLLSLFLNRAKKADDDEELEPELSVEDLLVSTQMEEAIEEEEKLAVIGINEGTEARQKLGLFIDDKPEAAAQLLRHWLNEAEY